jgi:hypothetical protein
VGSWNFHCIQRSEVFVRELRNAHRAPICRPSINLTTRDNQDDKFLMADFRVF